MSISPARVRLIASFVLILGTIAPSFVRFVIHVVVELRGVTASAGLAFSPRENYRLWLVHLFVFLILWALLERALSPPLNNLKTKRIALYGVGGSWCLTFVFTYWLNSVIMLGIVLGDAGASTNVIAYVFYPAYACIVMLVGYWVGKKIGTISGADSDLR